MFISLRFKRRIAIQPAEMYSSFIFKILIPTLLVSLFIAASVSQAKSSKKDPSGILDRDDDGEALIRTRREVLPHDDDGISGLIRGKRGLILDSDEETTTTSEIYDMEGEEVTTTETSFGYGDDVETTTVSFSTMDSDQFKVGFGYGDDAHEEEMTSTSDEMEVTTTETSFIYKDKVETSPLPIRLTSLQSTLQSVASSLQRPSEVSKQSNSGIKRLLDFMERQEYNPYEIPKENRTNTDVYKPAETDPVYVRIYLNIRSVSNIDEINEQVSLDIDLITQWFDDKLDEWYGNKNQTLREEYRQTWPQAINDAGVPLDSKILKNFWTPDISIEKLAKVSMSKILSRSERLRFTLWGKFIYVKRMTVKVNCEMDFKYYPADTQKCDFTLRSYSYNANDLELYWRQPEGVYLMETDDSNFDLQVVDVMRYNITTNKKRFCLDGSKDQASCDGEDIDPEENFDVLHFTLHMRRKISYQLLQTYIPSALYIAITWLCFMIPPKMVEGRIAIAMTTLLTLTSMFSSVRENTPIVSYIKAIDIWMAAGIVFIFLVLLEFTVLLWTEAGKKSKDELEANEVSPRNAANSTGISAYESVSAYERSFNWLRGKATMVIVVVEFYSFVIILFITMSFNIAYWTWLFVKSGYFGWSLDDKHNANNGSKYEEKMGDKQYPGF